MNSYRPLLLSIVEASMDTFLSITGGISFILGGCALMFAGFGHEYNQKSNPIYDAQGQLFFLKVAGIGVVLMGIGIWLFSLRS